MQIRISKSLFLLLGGLIALSLSAQKTIEVWGQEALSCYVSAERAGETLPPPEIVEAEHLFEKAKTGEVERVKLEHFAYWDKEGGESIRECAQALLLLVAIRSNNSAEYRSLLEEFRETFPTSVYTSWLSSPKNFMQECPSCNGRSNRSVHCGVCKDTGLCALCQGSGKRTLRGMRRTRRVQTHDPRVYNSGLSTKPRTGSHSTNYNRGIEVVENNDRDITCHRCKGTGACLTCANARRGVQCFSCKIKA